MNHPPHYAVVAARKSGVPGWEMCSVESLDDGAIFKLTGAARGVPYTRGPREGRPRCVEPHSTVYVSRAEWTAEEESYEATIGKCHQCFGTQQTWNGWTKGTGHSYKPCRRCDATGNAPKKETK